MQRRLSDRTGKAGNVSGTHRVPTVISVTGGTRAPPPFRCRRFQTTGAAAERAEPFASEADHSARTSSMRARFTSPRWTYSA